MSKLDIKVIIQRIFVRSSPSEIRKVSLCRIYEEKSLENPKNYKIFSLLEFAKSLNNYHSRNLKHR